MSEFKDLEFPESFDAQGLTDRLGAEISAIERQEQKHRDNREFCEMLSMLKASLQTPRSLMGEVLMRQYAEGD